MNVITKNDVIKTIGQITIAYPNFDKFRDEKHIAAMVILWSDYFAKDSSEIVNLAVKKHVMISKWPPSINDIREIMVSIMYPDIIDLDEAWTTVTKALFSYSEYDNEGVIYALPETIGNVVKAIGIGTLRQHARKNNGLDRVAFKDMYEAVIRKQREAALLPLSLREQIYLKSRAHGIGEREKLISIAQKAADKEQFLNKLSHIDSLYMLDQRVSEAPKPSLKPMSLTERND